VQILLIVFYRPRFRERMQREPWAKRSRRLYAGPGVGTPTPVRGTGAEGLVPTPHVVAALLGSRDCGVCSAGGGELADASA
jgi:hypothetical protein